jgi:hypothetical protein
MRPSLSASRRLSLILGHAHGRPPFGWRAAGRELVEDPAEQATLDPDRGLHGQGRSLRGIGAALEGEGRRPRRGLRWHPASVARILARAEPGR